MYFPKTGMLLYGAEYDQKALTLFGEEGRGGRGRGEGGEESGGYRERKREGRRVGG